MSGAFESMNNFRTGELEGFNLARQFRIHVFRACAPALDCGGALPVAPECVFVSISPSPESPIVGSATKYKTDSP